MNPELSPQLSSSQGGKVWYIVPPGDEFSFSWNPSDGYVNIETKTPQKTLRRSLGCHVGPM